MKRSLVGFIDRYFGLIFLSGFFALILTVYACVFDRSGLSPDVECGVCNPGDKTCMGDVVMICAGCGFWEDFDDCGVKEMWCVENESGAVCLDEPCVDRCGSPGAMRCSADRRFIEECGPDENGCLAWIAESSCGEGRRCVDTGGEPSVECVDCNLCDAGDARCPVERGRELEVCTDVGGCTGWEIVHCELGYLCTESTLDKPAECVSCMECVEGPGVCLPDGETVEICRVEEETGCLYVQTLLCPEGTYCVSGEETNLCEWDEILGVIQEGSTGYPVIRLGNQEVGDTGPVLDNYLVGDRYTVDAPMTVFAVSAYGESGGNVKIAIYDHDAANNLPRNRLFPEVERGLVSNGWTTIHLFPAVFLHPGNYWIVFNTTEKDGITYSSQTGGVRAWKQSSYGNGLPSSMTTDGWTASTSMDSTFISGFAIHGYAMASKIDLSSGNIEAGSLSLYTHGEGELRLAVYGDSAGPAALLWRSGPTVAIADSWNTVLMSEGFPPGLNLEAGTYWLAWQWDSSGAAGPGYAPGGEGESRYAIISYGDFPSAWPAGGGVSSARWSIHLSGKGYSQPLGW